MKSPAAWLLIAALAAAGCGPSSSSQPPAAQNTADHGHDHGHGHTHQHEHKPPHGGAPVVLGDEAFHLEFVRDAAAGRLTCYVMDAEFEKFVRIPAPGFTVTADVAGVKQPLAFAPVPNPATGETAGDTSEFAAQADWLRTNATFSAELGEISIRGRKFSAVAFKFPEGNEAH
jgi:hypothetical protein